MAVEGGSGEATLLTAAEAARLLGVKASTVRALGRRGDLPIIRPTGSRLVRFQLVDVHALIARRRQGGPDGG